ncbi:MAG: hypothetical protein GQ573_03570 [Gammaproteobacteria bacterium]|nr:hypothetical protein [Gammaproteobacteria bacterium]
MSDNFTMRIVRSICYGAVLLLIINMRFPAAASGSAKPLKPPSQIAALCFAYRAMSTHTCGQGIDPRSCTTHEQDLAIIRTDYRVLPNGMASVWMELLAQPQATSHIPAPIIRTTIELELLSTPEGRLLTTAKRTLSSETWEPEMDMQAALAETRLRGLVYRWLILFEQPDIDKAALLAHIRPSTTLNPATGPSLTGREQISNWITAQQQRNKKLQQQVETINIALLAAQRYRLDFAVNWQARRTNGALHIGRKEYHWEVELGTDGVMHITHIQQRDALPLPNTGTRIFC